MGIVAIREAIKKTLEAVDGMGKVHDMRRDVSHWEEIYRLQVEDGRLNNWEVTLTSTAQEVGAIQNKAGNEPFFHDTHVVNVLGHMSVKDEKETEKLFHALVDKVIAAFRTNNTLGGILLLPAQLQGPTIEYRMFGPVFVHFAEMSFEAVERVGG